MSLKDLIEQARRDGHDALGFSRNPTLVRVSINQARERAFSEPIGLQLIAWARTVESAAKTPRMVSDLALFLRNEAHRIMLVCRIIDAFSVPASQGERAAEARTIAIGIQKLVDGGEITSAAERDADRVLKEHQSEAQIRTLAGATDLEPTEARRLLMAVGAAVE
jgi:hypothetical protein